MNSASPTSGPDPSFDGRRRVVIDAVRPAVDGGRYPVKRVLGDVLRVETDLLADGHDRLDGALLYRRRGEPEWRSEPLQPVGAAPGPMPGPPADDVWCAAFVVDALGTWEYTVSAWIDAWSTWCWGLRRKLEAGQDVAVDLLAGAALIDEAAVRAVSTTGADERDARALRRLARDLASAPATAPATSPSTSSGADQAARAAPALSADTAAMMRAHADRSAATTRQPALTVTVEPARARFSSWYELFPRSTGTAGKHGTLRDAAGRLPYIAEMGFDVVYLPPIHPIGHTHRKGRDNRLTVEAGDPGSPWAIGGPEGGHRSIHPELGTIDDFRHFLQVARTHGIEVALDIAFQTSPDHPYVREHPEWFAHRPDGSIQYAENPPKKYQDIYPFAFAGPAWDSLWNELRDVFLYWIEQGVTIFRVDNPHTKPLPFWRWCIASIKERHPETIFLAEAFTRPKLMYALAKAGFSQSYTYFAWRTTKDEITRYVRSIADGDVREYFRPNFWPATPDILPEHLQVGTRATFIARATLAATLSPSWGIYGPAYELQERAARDGAEEYAHNEKYELRAWDIGRAGSLSPVLRRLNQIRRDSPELQRVDSTVFHDTDNPEIICYSRRLPPAPGAGPGAAQSNSGGDDGDRDGILVVVNLDPHHRQEGWVSLNMPALGLGDQGRFQVHDLIGDARYLWSGPRAFLSLDPQVMPAQIFRVRRLVRSERTFEYFL